MLRRTQTLWAVNANWNADNGGWNVEANSVENPNRWNDGNQVVSRYPFLSLPSLGGVFARSPLRQPPIMRPTSSTEIAILSNCLVDMSFASQAICRKKRIESAFVIAVVRTGIFSLTEE